MRTANLLTSSAIGVRKVLHFIVIIIILNYRVLNYNLILIRFYRARISIYQKYVSRNNPHETRCGNGTQVKPCRSGLRTGWVTNREYRRKGPYVVLPFFLLLFCVLCGVIVNSVLKSRFSIISASGFRKRKKQRTNMARCSSLENYYSSGRNFADFDLYIGGETCKLRNLGLRQCKMIIMPLISISCSSVSCRRCLRCAKRCSFRSFVSY